MLKRNRLIVILFASLFLTACSQGAAPTKTKRSDPNARTAPTSVLQPVSGEETALAVQRVFAAAGVPKYIAESRDYDVVFSTLSEAGVAAFFPTFQYQENPAPASLGYEFDFLPPCTSDDPVFQAMRANEIQLVVPGGLIYPPGEMPSLEDDPLVELLECAGLNGIAAVLSIDEPFGAVRDPAKPYQNVQVLYERVRCVAPGVPVWMVHAPIPAALPDEDGLPRPVTQEEIEYYLAEVDNFSAYADGYGFDVYPIPMEIANITAPYQNGEVADYLTTIENYTRWLNEDAAGKTTFLVLQGFSYERLFNDGVDIPAPTETELREMVCRVWENGVEQIIWWGQSFLLAEDQPLWEAILRVTGEASANPARYCTGDLSGER